MELESQQTWQSMITAWIWRCFPMPRQFSNRDRDYGTITHLPLNKILQTALCPPVYQQGYSAVASSQTPNISLKLLPNHTAYCTNQRPGRTPSILHGTRDPSLSVNQSWPLCVVVAMPLPHCEFLLAVWHTLSVAEGLAREVLAACLQHEGALPENQAQFVKCPLRRAFVVGI